VRTLSLRLPGSLVAQIEAEAKRRGLSKSDVVRERLEAGACRSDTSSLESIADLVGAVEGLPEDLSARRKTYLKTSGYGRKRPG
jgi:hypothetical protein